MKNFFSLFVYFVLILNTSALAQSLVEDANLASNVESANVFNETIKIISGSRKIFILSNNNQQLGPGDFISLALDNNLAARAVVAKVHQGQVGIKILKIYSLTQWSKLRRNLEVQVVRGDDSQFNKKPVVQETAAQSESIIKSEEDLFNTKVTIDDEGIFEETSNRHIKPDNVVSLSGAFLEASEIESKGGKVRSNEFGIGWAHQFTDNYFIEAVYGRATFNSYPNDGIQTLVNHLTGRLKFNIKGPLYTFFMPYIGYHSYTVSSPEAGDSGNPTIDQEEEDAINNLRKSGPIFGVTVLRRLVPGWFVKADLGTDIINVGFAIEF